MGLRERLDAGPVVCAEGYVWELERRGYLQAGPFVPEVVLEHPEVVLQLHRDLVHAGSDIVVALTYYAHREKLRLIGKETALERLNREALGLAAQVARETGTLLAGDIANTNVYLEGDPDADRAVRAMFEEQVGWAVDARVDFVVAETMSWAREAILAVEVIRAAGLPVVVTLALHREDATFEGWPVAEACRRLEQAGADVVGLNCIRGPATMLPPLREIRAAVSCHVAALPVPFRTAPEQPTFSSLADPAYAVPGGRAFPTALDPFTCNRYEVADFAREACGLGVRYLGVCCGAGSHHVRAMAEALGRTVPASRYAPDMSRHAFFGTDEQVRAEYRDDLSRRL